MGSSTEGESLKNYMKRLNDAIFEINFLNQAIGIPTINQDLSHEWFWDNLIKHPLITFNKVNERSQKFIIVEEYSLSHKLIPNKESQSPTWREEAMKVAKH